MSDMEFNICTQNKVFFKKAVEKNVYHDPILAIKTEIQTPK